VQKVLNNKWLEIDVGAITNNLEMVKSLLEDNVRLIAVLKADAYGHGAVEVAHILLKNGVDYFAVTFLEEALELRKAGISSDILLFSPIISEEQLIEAILNNITLTITSSYDSELIDKVSKNLNRLVTVHLKVETGLGRFGLKTEEIIEKCFALKDNPNIYIEGIYTHMAEGASINPSYTERQFSQFMDIIQELSEAGIKISLRHCANSAVFLKYPHMHLDAVRIGTLLSGQYPAGKFSQPLRLIDPFKLKTRIISLKTMKAGSYLGYSRTYRLKKKAQIAVIPVGLIDGLALDIANKPAGFIDFMKIIIKKILSYVNISSYNLSVIFKGRSYPIRGKVFMQMALIELPFDVDVKIGDEVEVPIRKTLVGKNIKRIYVKEEKGCTIEHGEIDTLN